MSFASHKPSTCFGCPLHATGKGFCLDRGDFEKAKYLMVFEAPGLTEIQWRVDRPVAGSVFETQRDCDAEIARRRKTFPTMEDRFIRTGAPVVGPTGAVIDNWIWRKVGIDRKDIAVSNVLRCLPPKGKTAQYPTGEDRKAAEKHCRQYDRIGQFRPDTAVITLHPASLLRAAEPLSLVVKDFEKVRDFASQGRRVMTLLGGKSSKAFLRYGENVTRWRGHYAELSADWPDTYKALFDYKAKGTKKRVSRKEISESEIFAEPRSMRERAAAMRTRPEEMSPVACKSVKRFKGKSVPKCSCVPCWDLFESVQKGELNHAF